MASARRSATTKSAPTLQWEYLKNGHGQDCAVAERGGVRFRVVQRYDYKAYVERWVGGFTGQWIAVRSNAARNNGVARSRLWGSLATAQNAVESGDCDG